MNIDLNIIKVSIKTSMLIKLFKSIQEASEAHIFKSKFENISMSLFKDNNVENFDSNRLQDSAVKAYPIHNRPRGIDDIKSIKYYQQQIRTNKFNSPIWLAYKNRKYTLLDGAHRLVAHHIENKIKIPAYVIKI
jgi:hypothetical protein